MVAERLSMRKIKEVLRLKFESHLSHRAIGRSCCISHATVAKYIRRAEAAKITWPLPEELDDQGLELLLFVREPRLEALP